MNKNTARQPGYRRKAARSCVISICFALFNAVLGIVYGSVWNGSISVYYMVLSVIRGIVVFADRGKSRRVCKRTHILMIFMDLCLIAPIAYMVMGKRAYQWGMIPAIAMAAYTTYRVTMAVIQYRSSRKRKDPLLREIRVIDLQDALAAVLTLQNALIIANGSSAESMIGLTGWTSAAIWLAIVFLTVWSFPGIKKKAKREAA